MTQPLLYVFTVSHFCEKARWALDYKGIGYQLRTVLPGPHRLTVPKLAPTSRVPVLVDGATTLQDSGPIIDYIDELHEQRALTPSDPALRSEAVEWEEYLDVELGEAVRRYLYRFALSAPGFVGPLYVQDGPWWARPFYTFMLRPVIAAAAKMYLRPTESGADDLRRIRAVFTRADQRLAEHRYLVGDEFTRADLTFAALAAPILRPAGHPAKWPPDRVCPPELIAETKDLRDSRAGRHVYELYRTLR
ncbi:MAG TPA: glutathione S-transferase family protein [Polyangiaceae bacterium]|jgi:glutathione S-transferase|nr:glutathione S-transferase family protein [Polyangiaceae bacterium]